MVLYHLLPDNVGMCVQVYGWIEWTDCLILYFRYWFDMAGLIFYWLISTFLFLAGVAFLVALHQNRALIGKNGLLPADKFLGNIKNRYGNEIPTLLQVVPSVLWFFDYENHIDELLDGLAYVGLALSAAVVFLGAANIPMMLAIWAIYHSIVNVGQRWWDVWTLY